MKKKAYLSKQAEADLDDIWWHIAQDSVRNADRFLADIHRKCKTLASSPGIGRRREELRPSLRSFPWGEYVIFYRSSTEGIEVVRILHGRRDIDKVFRLE